MAQTLTVVVLFMAGMAALPWLVRRIQQRQAVGGAAQAVGSKVVSAVSVGPQQRVVTVEVGPDHARTWLVLGVTAQQITCLHTLPAGQAAPRAPDFAQTLRQEAGATAEPARLPDTRHGA